MKVDLKEFRELMVAQIQDIAGGKKAATAIVDKMAEVSQNYLRCSVCETILPKEAFYVQKAAKAREGRGTVCRTCFRKAYPTS